MNAPAPAPAPTPTPAPTPATAAAPGNAPAAGAAAGLAATTTATTTTAAAAAAPAAAVGAAAAATAGASVAAADAASGLRSWRHLAAALRGIEDFDRFTAALQSALGGSASPWQLDWSPTGDAAPAGAAGGLMAPIEAEGRAAGQLRWQPGRPLGASDLHLLGDLADFLSAALALSWRAQRDAERRALLRLLLDQAPVGIVALRGAEILIANGLAERWLSELGTQWLAAGAQVHQGAVSGHLIYAEVRETVALSEVRIAVLHDLSAQQARLLEALQTAYYRVRATPQEATFVLLEARQASGRLFRAQGELARVLGDSGRVGPYDATRIGAVVTERGPALRARLRRLRGTSLWEHCQLALVALKDVADPEEALGRVARQAKPIAEALHPRILVADASTSVLEAVRTLLHGQAHVARTRPETLRQDLLQPEVDGALIEYAAVAPQVESWCAWARTRAPGLRLAFSVPSPLCAVAEAELPVLAKPFAGEALRRALLPE